MGHPQSSAIIITQNQAAKSVANEEPKQKSPRQLTWTRIGSAKN